MTKLLMRILCIAVALMMVFALCSCGENETASNDDGTVSAEDNSESAESTDANEPDYTKVTVNIKQNAPFTTKALDKEAISVILVIGQSNFTTGVGAPDELRGIADGTDTELSAVPDAPPAGTCYSSTVVTELAGHNDIAQLVSDGKMGGICPSFGNMWHSLTGTKVVFVQAAVGAVGMHEWVPDPSVYTCGCTNNGGGKLYANAVSRFKQTVDALSKNYKIAITGYIWNQGEHEEVYGVEPNTICSEDTYFAAYKYMHESLMEDLKLDFGGICVVRADKCKDKTIIDKAQGSMSLNIGRVAQYRAANEIDKCYLISRVSETCELSDMTKYNGGGIHYNQRTFNKMGADAATNLFKALGFEGNAEYGGVSFYNKNGLKLVSFDKDGKVIDGNAVMKQNADNTQILATLDTLGTTCTWSLSGDEGCVDENGYIDWNKVKTVDGKRVIKLCVNYEA